MANALVPVSPRRDRGATENVDTKGKPVTYLDFSFLDVTQMGGRFKAKKLQFYNNTLILSLLHCGNLSIAL